jgi:hypothetical protein
MFNWFKRKKSLVPPAPPPKDPSRFFGDDQVKRFVNPANVDEALAKTFQQPLPQVKTMDVAGTATDAAPRNHAMDAFGGAYPALGGYSTVVPEGMLMWYASQGFIGYVVCAILSQHWLISKACRKPALAAVRNWFEVTRNDGTELSPKEHDKLRELDKKYKLKKHLIEYLFKGRVFGIRIAKYVVESSDPLYYEKPFNIDGVKPGTYKGIVQVDPTWAMPYLDVEAASKPGSMHFYEPTYWVIDGQRIHRTHLSVYRTEEPADILKPAYLYGGIPVPQKIFRRVYAAERTADEIPMLLLTKRTTRLGLDLAAAISNQAVFDEKIKYFTHYRDNQAVYVGDIDEDYQQFDTSLADTDSVTMLEYQLVAAGADLPATELLGTSPKGFNATGEYEESSYHETLEGYQSNDLTPFVEGHYLRMIKSDLAPGNPFDVTIHWKPLDAMTGKEEAEVNKIKADTDNVLVLAGAINGDDVRKRVIADPASGYSGLIDGAAPEQPEEDDANADED